MNEDMDRLVSEYMNASGLPEGEVRDAVRRALMVDHEPTGSVEVVGTDRASLIQNVRLWGSA